ncbi:MAG: pentapeptide repeat-containing protein, partial [Bradyrhizobium sp.]
MKARASNLMIGSTALVVIAAAFVGLLGFQKIHSVQQRGPLRVVFEGSATGLRKGGSVNFDGVQVGQIISLKLDNPRKVVALAMVDNNAPIRKDTIVGLEFQGLTGVAAISLTGGASAAPPVPLDEDGIPTLSADLSETELGDADLREANLGGADVKRANLSRANLSWAHLNGADLSGTLLVAANLYVAHLTGAHLTGADLTGANLSWADLSRA